MIIRTKKEKEQIYNSFKAFLLMNGGYNLKSFCRKFQYDYGFIYQKLARNGYHIDTSLVNKMVHDIDKNQYVQYINGRYVIGRKI